MSKSVRMMTLRSCPHCHRAFELMQQLEEDNPSYASVCFEVLDEEEHKEIADQLDYYYVPCYFVDGEKIFEGVPSEEKIKEVYDAALAL